MPVDYKRLELELCITLALLRLYDIIKENNC
jgi:hypothetical protein